MSPPAIDGRQYAIGAAGTVITFERARHGHRYRIDFGKQPVAKRMPEAGCKLMARWWSRERGGCAGECPKCKNLNSVDGQASRTGQSKS